MEEIFAKKGDEFFLVGSRCKSCEQLFFPKRETCSNCSSLECEDILLNRKGKLYSYTVSYMPVHHFNPPYAIGYVELPEGIRIFTPLSNWDEKKLKTGMEMELEIDKLWEDGEDEVIGYKFKPI